MRCDRGLLGTGRGANIRYAKAMADYEGLQRKGHDKGTPMRERGRAHEQAAELAASEGLGTVRRVTSAREAANAYAASGDHESVARVIEEHMIGKREPILGISGIGNDMRVMYDSARSAVAKAKGHEHTTTLARILRTLPAEQ